MSPCPSESPNGDFNGPERRACDRLSPEGLSPITLVNGQQSLACRIENVSLSGVLLAFEASPPPLGQVTLEHETAGRIPGEAVWRDGARMGVRLCEPATEMERALQCLNMIKGSRAG